MKDFPEFVALLLLSKGLIGHLNLGVPVSDWHTRTWFDTMSPLHLKSIMSNLTSKQGLICGPVCMCFLFIESNGSPLVNSLRCLECLIKSPSGSSASAKHSCCGCEEKNRISSDSVRSYMFNRKSTFHWVLQNEDVEVKDFGLSIRTGFVHCPVLAYCQFFATANCRCTLKGSGTVI